MAKEKEDALFLLIKSLNKAQKRYIKVNSTHIIGKKNNYMRLFDALDKMEEYDEDKLATKFKGTNFIKHLPSEKNYLYEFILKNMRSYNTDRTITFRIQSLLQDIYFLFEKGLHDACYKRIKKAKKLCYKYDTFYYLLELIDWERKLIKFKFSDDQNAKVKEQMEEMNEVMELIKNERDFRNVYDELFLTLKSDYYSISESRLAKVKEIMKDELLSSESQALSFSAKTYFYESYIAYYNLQKDVENGYKVHRALVKLWEDKPELMKEKLSRYKTALRNLAATSYAAGNFDEFHATIGKMKSLPARSLNEEAEDFQGTYFLELFYYINHSEFDQALELVPEISAKLSQFSHMINQPMLIGFYYNLAVLYLIVEDYHHALDWVNKILDMRLDTREDIQHFSRVLQLIIHYEISPPQVVEYIYGSTYRYLYKNERINKFEKLVFGYVRKLNNVPEKREMLRLFAKLHEELEALKLENPHVIGLEELICWIDTKLQKRPFREILSERLEMEKQAMEGKK